MISQLIIGHIWTYVRISMVTSIFIAFDDTDFWLSKKKHFFFSLRSYFIDALLTKMEEKSLKKKQYFVKPMYSLVVSVVKWSRMIIAYIIKFHSRIVQCRINNRSSGMERAFVRSNDFFFLFLLSKCIILFCWDFF